MWFSLVRVTLKTNKKKSQGRFNGAHSVLSLQHDNFPRGMWDFNASWWSVNWVLKKKPNEKKTENCAAEGHTGKYLTCKDITVFGRSVSESHNCIQEVRNLGKASWHLKNDPQRSVCLNCHVCQWSTWKYPTFNPKKKKEKKNQLQSA